ncbi:MAG TPA: hypothetical protein VLA51_14350, partial [Paracoccaceae bacterium]|nr:hypothetical protein [Paracoccaceae bacterium]
MSSPFAKSANPDVPPSRRRLSDLSDIERSDFIIRQFIASEKQEALYRSYESEPVCRNERLNIAREDLAAIEGSPHYQQYDWLSVARQALERDGISIDPTRDAATLRSIADMLRRGAIVSARRTERAINGTPFGLIDPSFDTFHQDSPLPQATKESKTVGDLQR